ncbi:MAG: NCS2 family permease [Acetivibrio ethanolgignens]
MNQKLEQWFHLKENHTDVKTEVIAGITTFMAMAYILAVNPSILADAGMDKGAVFTATVLASAFATILMALLSNYPFVLAPGMGLNAYFAYSVVIGMGYSWQMALAAVFTEGIIFIVLSVTNVREAIFNAIPMSLKHAVTVGIGLFIAFIGLQNAHVIVTGAKLVTLYSFKGAIADGSIRSVGVGVILALLGILFTGVLIAKNVKGNILWGILGTWGVAIILELVGVYVPNPELGMYSTLPDFSSGFGIPSIMPTLGQCFKIDPSELMSFNFIVVIFSFLFVDLFDTLGTLIGVSTKADMLDENGHLPKIRGALLSDALGTSAGAVFGTSTTTTFVESAAGVAEGGRTGLTALVSAALFLIALFLSPIFLAIPSFATAPALVVVGFLMAGSILKIDFSDATESLPAFICLLIMPLAYSISEGIAFGFISYVVVNVASGKAREKKISPLMYVLSLLFILKYIFIQT